MVTIALPDGLFIEALKEIRYYQTRANLIFPKAPFRRLVKEISSDNTRSGLRWQSTALDALQVAAESTLVTLFECKVTIFSNELCTNKWQAELMR